MPGSERQQKKKKREKAEPSKARQGTDYSEGRSAVKSAP